MADAQKKKFGKFELLGELARGGMGVVYRAWQKDLDRTVALKVLTSSKEQAVAVQAFLREAKAAARLVHPNIVPIYDTGVEAGQSYFTMEYVDGPNFAQFRREAAPDLTQILAICRDVAHAVQFAHEAGIVHRDIKPHNLLITKSGQPKIADFGVASIFGAPPAPGTVLVPGTPEYMSPEQAGGHPERVDARSDIFSLGVVLYEALTGRVPFPGSSERDVIQRILRDDPTPVRRIAPEVPPDVESVVHRALEKDPARRFASARELADALDACLTAGVQPVPPPVRRAVGRVVGLPVPLGVVLVAIPLVAAAIWFWREHRAAQEEARKEARIQDEARRKREQEALARNFFDRASLLKGKEAYQTLTLALQADGEYTAALVRRAQVGLELGKTKEAIADLDHAIASNPRLAYAFYWRGIAYQDYLENADKALPDFAAVQRLDPDSAIGFFAEAAALEARRRYPEAVERFSKAIERDPTSAMAWYRRGGVEQAQGANAAAEADYRKATELDPALCAARHSLGLLLAEAGKLDAALEALNRVIECDPKSPVYLQSRGLVLLARRDFDAAITDFTKALERDSRLAPAFLGRARAWQSKGNVDAALRDLNFAVAVAPAFPDSWLLRGSVLFGRSRYLKAIHDWQRFLTLAPDDPRAAGVKRQIDVAWEREKSRPEEEVRADEALDAGTDALLKKAYAAAVEDLKRALHLNPKLQAAKYALACVYAAWSLEEAVAARRDEYRAEGLGWLEQALQSGFTSVPDARADPALEGLRCDPRFEAMLKQN